MKVALLWIYLISITSFIDSITIANTCPDNDILHLNWQSLHQQGSSLTSNWPYFDYDISFDQFTLEVIIDVNLTYLGYSTDKDGNELGTTYVLDFESKEAHIVPLNEPGTCSNRRASDFINASFSQWFEYSTNDPPVPFGGSTTYLAYPPGGRDWFIESTSCDTVRYRGNYICI